MSKHRQALMFSGRDALAEAVDRVLNLHDEAGQRWVGFPRADRLERYCTECNKAAPCPTRWTVLDAIGGE